MNIKIYIRLILCVIFLLTSNTVYALQLTSVPCSQHNNFVIANVPVFVEDPQLGSQWHYERNCLAPNNFVWQLYKETTFLQGHPLTPPLDFSLQHPQGFALDAANLKMEYVSRKKRAKLILLFGF
ncbi:MAG: hypothetical protein V3V61_00150 [Gammaproteobacteria bacterium]